MPIIHHIEPAYGPLNQLVTIYGNDFGKDNSRVIFGPVEAQVASWTDNKIEASFPSASQQVAGIVWISVIVNNTTSNSVPFTIKS